MMARRKKTGRASGLPLTPAERADFAAGAQWAAERRVARRLACPSGQNYNIAADEKSLERDARLIGEDLPAHAK